MGYPLGGLQRVAQRVHLRYRSFEVPIFYLIPDLTDMWFFLSFEKVSQSEDGLDAIWQTNHGFLIITYITSIGLVCRRLWTLLRDFLILQTSASTAFSSHRRSRHVHFVFIAFRALWKCLSFVSLSVYNLHFSVRGDSGLLSVLRVLLSLWTSSVSESFCSDCLFYISCLSPFFIWVHSELQKTWVRSTTFQKLPIGVSRNFWSFPSPFKTFRSTKKI